MKPLFQTLVALSDKVAGRDKVYRVFQYFLKALLPFIQSHPKAAALKTLASHFSNLRRFFRMLKPLSMYADLKVSYLKLTGKIPINTKIEQYLLAKFLMDCFTFTSFTLQIIEWFRKLEAIVVHPKLQPILDWITSLEFAIGSLFSIMVLPQDLLLYLRAERANLRDKAFRQKMRTKQKNTCISLARSWFDLFNALHTCHLDYVPEWMAYFLSGISSLIALVNVIVNL